VNLWLLVPCPGRRTHELVDLAKTLALPPNRVVAVTTPPDPVNRADVAGLADTLITMPSPDMLFGVWLNTGLDHIATQVRDGETYEIACLSSDARCTAEDVPLLVDALRAHQLAMTGPDLHGHLAPGEVLISRGADPRTLHNRIHGSAFVVAGELGLRFDPQFRWWYSDDDFETQARVTGGVGLVGGTSFHHLDHPPTAQAQEWAPVDRAKYVAKWGHEPW